MSVHVLSPAVRGRAAPVLAALVALALAGCGRIGPLEPPGGVPKSTNQNTGNPADQAKSLNARAKIPPITPPIRDLPIDFLLK